MLLKLFRDLLILKGECEKGTRWNSPFFFITELAKRWGLPIEHLLLSALDKKLTLLFYRERGGYIPASDNILRQILHHGQAHYRYRYIYLKELLITKNERDRFEQENEIARQSASQVTAERETLLKMLLGMAIAAYQFDPVAKRNTATGSNRGSIAADLEDLGLAVDPDTIRKHLAEAIEHFADKLPVRPHKP
jgi:hypothetical protein